jgi:hypothetical protein
LVLIGADHQWTSPLPAIDPVSRSLERTVTRSSAFRPLRMINR